MILRGGVRGPDRGRFASLLFSYFLSQTYYNSSFHDCNSAPKKVPRKSYCERLKTAILSLVSRNSAQIMKHRIEFVLGKSGRLSLGKKL